MDNQLWKHRDIVGCKLIIFVWDLLEESAVWEAVFILLDRAKY